MIKNRNFQTRSASLFAIALFTSTISCTLGSPGGSYQQLLSQPLSRTDPNFRTCVFDPSYSIVYFPMFHFPYGGHYSLEEKEKVARSQFQLFHTLLDYSQSYWNLSLFEETFITDVYDEAYFRSLKAGQRASEEIQIVDGRRFNIEERMRTAEFLFRYGLTREYELLNQNQKDFLFDMGASFTLYLLGRIPRIHKVISPSQWELVKANILDINGRFLKEGNNYWIFTVREQALRKEVTDFYARYYQPGSLIFIAYGAEHKLSDDFAGYPFQSGHDLCLGWANKY